MRAYFKRPTIMALFSAMLVARGHKVRVDPLPNGFRVSWS